MRKLTTVVLTGLLAASLMPIARAGKAPQQSVNGSVAVMAPYTDGTCYTGLHRRQAVVSQGVINGGTGYHFDIDPKTVNKPFKVEVTGGQADVDLDITFYAELGTVEQATDTSYAPANVSYEERGAGGEVGKVPPGMTKAIVCMVQGAGASFTYTAGPGVK